MELVDPLEIEHKRRQLVRLLISYNDFKQAAEFAALARSSDGHYAFENHLMSGAAFDQMNILRALNMAACVSYCRPFSGNDRSTEPKISDLPQRFVRELDSEERKLHDHLLELRDTSYVHSDSAAWDLDLSWRNGKCGLEHNDVWAPFKQDWLKRIQALSNKMRERCHAERQSIESELYPILGGAEESSDTNAAQPGVKPDVE